MKIKDMNEEQINKMLAHNCCGVDCFADNCFLCAQDRQCVATEHYIDYPEFDVDLERLK